MGLGFLEAGAQSSFKEAKVVILPLPYDATASWGTGARFGPERILRASWELELFDEELVAEPFKVGVHTAEPPEIPLLPQKAVEVIKDSVSKIIDSSKLPISIGGDHSITIGAVEAVKHFVKDLTVVQFDAHADLRDSFQGTKLSHGCVIRRLWKWCNIVQVGIRSLSKEEWEFLQNKKSDPIWAHQVHIDLRGAIQQVISNIQTKHVYITIDVDCFDPSIMPATGTPEPGGLNWYQITAFLKEICKLHKVVGADLVELAPIPGLNHPEFTAARLIYKLVGYIFKS